LAFYTHVQVEFENYFKGEFSIIDIGAGNGCCGLFWPNQVYFIDKRRPNTFNKLKQKIPKNNFEYKEVLLDDFDFKEVKGEKAIVGIHTCGELSDSIIQKGIEYQLPISLMPCCHSTTKQYKLHKEISVPFYNNYSRYIDDLRVKHLEENNFECKTMTLETIISDKNRLIIAIPE